MEAKTIRFEHPYVKLGCEPLFMFGPDVFCDGDRAQLIAVQKCNVKDLSEGLVEYDTSYYTKNGKLAYYPLPKGDVILLVFASFGITAAETRLFTTIRSVKSSWGADKLEYYNSLLFQEFVIKIKPEGKTWKKKSNRK